MKHPEAAEIIKEAEGLKLSAYYCPAGKITIGYGHTEGVQMGDTCTEEQALEWLAADMEIAEAATLKLVKVPLSENQLGAMTSFVFNLGAFKIRNSTLIRKLNAGDYGGAAREFEKWVYSGGDILGGLVTRRKKECDLFLKPVETHTTV